MGTNMPQDRGDALSWVEQHLDPWTENQAAIDLSADQVAAITLLAQTARTKLTEAGEARSAAKAATAAWHEAADQMKSYASDLILELKSYARGEGGDVVYQLAQISKRADPSEAPPPSVPSDLRSTVTNEGGVKLNWKGKGPTGTRYHVVRQLPGELAFSFIGDTSDKVFTDDTVPSGATPVVYQIIAVHTDNRVPGEPMVVRFGAGNQGQQGEQAA
ncbi:MAG: hypothetical protein RIE77_03680 [Phycisphaerales bacterium]|jgi:hypothetical protein